MTRCWFGHAWGRWEDVQLRHDPADPWIAGQQRRCKRCNRRKVKRV